VRHRRVGARSLAGLFLCVAMGVAALPLPADAWVPHTAHVTAVKTARPPSLDPALTDPVWQTGVAFDDFYDFTNHRAAAFATTGHLLYDDTNLYVGVHCAQAGRPITATQTVDHAGVATDDHVSIYLETSGSGAREYNFRSNPRGVHDESSSENARYAPDWKSITTILPNGDWNLVMVIPLKVVRAKGGDKQSWRFDIERFVAGSNDEYTWAYDETMQSISGYTYWPYLDGIAIATQASRPKPRADIYGLATAGADRGVFQNGIGNFQPLRPRPYGIDATVPLTNTLAFVGTLNPDFSNVEQDQTTIAPQEFQRQYTEYRPFFSQGAQYINALPGININSADQPFYSPSIGVFNQGTKLEGTQGRSAIGLLNVSGAGFNDTAYGYSFNTPNNTLTLATSGVLANHAGIRDDVTGYGIATTNPRDGVFALAKITLDRGTNVTAPAQADDLQVGGGVQNAHTLFIAKYTDIGPHYAPIDGYLQESDLRGPQIFYQYTGSGPKDGFLKTFAIVAGTDRYVDRSGAAHEADVFSAASVTFTNLVTISLNQSSSELRFYGSPYPVYANPFVLPFDSDSVSLGYRDGTPAPIDATFSVGPYANNALQPVFLQQLSLSTSAQRGVYGISLAYNGAIEHAERSSLAPSIDSQWLRSIALTRSFGRDASLAVGLREVNGNGGYAPPGTNLAISYHKRFRNLDELYFDYGTPAAASTLNRVILKFIFHVGGQTGT
jgi:hypothetical protein